MIEYIPFLFSPTLGTRTSRMLTQRCLSSRSPKEKLEMGKEKLGVEKERVEKEMPGMEKERLGVEKGRPVVEKMVKAKSDALQRRVVQGVTSRLRASGPERFQAFHIRDSGFVQAGHSQL